MKLMRLSGFVMCGVLAGCGSDGVVRPPQVDVKMVDAAPRFGPLAVLRERSTAASLQFGAGIATSFDSGQYDFTVSYAAPGTNAPVDVVTKAWDLAPGSTYAFVVVAPNDQLDFFVVPFDDSSFSDGIARVSVVHADPDSGPLDVYVAPAGSDLSGLAPNANISFAPDKATIDVVPGTPHLFLTPENTPGTILFESGDIDALGGTENRFIVSGNGGRGFVDLIVFDVTDTVRQASRVDVGSQLRVIQGIDDRMDRDVLIDSETPPFISSLAFGQLSPDLDLTTNVHTAAITPVGVPGTEEASASFQALRGRNHIAVVAGDSTDGIDIVVVQEDRRHLIGQGTLNIINLAGLFDAVEFLLMPPMTDPNMAVNGLSLSAPAIVTQLGVEPSDYDIAIRDPATSTILAGPTTITIEDGGLYGITISNGADGSTVDIGYFYDFLP